MLQVLFGFMIKSFLGKKCLNTLGKQRVGVREQTTKQLKQNRDQHGSLRKQLEDVKELFSEKLQQLFFCSLCQLSIFGISTLACSVI